MAERRHDDFAGRVSGLLTRPTALPPVRPSCSGRRSCRPSFHAPVAYRRRGYTLVELTVSLGVMTVLMAGMASAMLVATHALPDRRATANTAAETVGVADQLAEDLRGAMWMSERTAAAVTFTVADRSGDGLPERIRYAWSGAAGEPLTRAYNGGAAVEMLPDVHEFDLAYDTTTEVESYPGPVIKSAETSLRAYTTGPNLAQATITNNQWIGEYFKPQLPPEAVSWSVNSIYFRARQYGTANGTTLVRIHMPAADHTPDAMALEEVGVAESALPISSAPFTWYPVSFTSVKDIPKDKGLCLLLTTTSSLVSCETEYHNGGVTFPDAGMLVSNSQGSTWFVDEAKALRFMVYGTYTVPGPPQTATRHFVSGVRVALRAGDDPATRVVTAAPTANAPEVLSGLWQANFKIDPRLDWNGDSVGDWTCRSGGFNPSALTGGVWQATTCIETNPISDFAGLTTVLARMRGTVVGATGATVTVHADWSGTTAASISAQLILQADGTQVLTVSHKLGVSTSETLLRVVGISAGFHTVRLMADPILDTVNVRLDDQEWGTYRYTRINQASMTKYVEVGVSGTSAHYDFVSVRVGQ
ncbi:MAG: prepilin-type N-terminal cleavage/methylation domain-containing protein [Phycisphaerae bacterium]|nr:prepilin-type N-terminal cleavage/methylation domain-containing protein [Phycisphaerae bacterium]